jgi:ATP-dependent RNA helicase RhlE
LAIFNKYHEINGAAIQSSEENVADEANVIIGAPDLLLDVSANSKVDLTKVDILVVDDINLIKKNKQLENLEKVLEILPPEKQNIVYTNRRSKETQDILEKILKAPEEIKVDKTKEQEVETPSVVNKDKKAKTCFSSVEDKEAVELAAKFKSFNGKTPSFILIKGVIAEGEEK